MATPAEASNQTNSYPTHPDAETPRARGDAITGERYWSKAFAEREWERMWKRVWHVGGRTAQLQEPGDFIVHDFRHESVLMVKQRDGSIRAYFNVCMHRANQLLSVEEGFVDGGITCPYHGWRYDLDGLLIRVQDPEDFPQGDPCGRLRLRELHCETWGGFVFWSFDPDAKPLLDYLEPIPCSPTAIWKTTRASSGARCASTPTGNSPRTTSTRPTTFRPCIRSSCP